MPNTVPERDPRAPLHVMAAVLRNATGAVLLAQRPPGSHQGGLWEFPGGKLEPGETPRQALTRELREELDVELLAARPFQCVEHAYENLTVRLDVWEVLDWRGVPRALAGPALRWVLPAQLEGLPMPAADRPLVAALQLPDRLLVTPDPGRDTGRFLADLERSVTTHRVGMVQLRAHALDGAARVRLAREVRALCDRLGVLMVLNGTPEEACSAGAEGVHLTRHRLSAYRQRPTPAPRWLSVACHDARELDQARQVGADLVLVSPVAATASHPDSALLGWEGFARLARDAGRPCYALGGVGPGDLDSVRGHGGRGIAAMSRLWCGG